MVLEDEIGATLGDHDGGRVGVAGNHQRHDGGIDDANAGEPEEAIRTEREAGGIPLDDMTWTQILDTAQKLGLDSDAVEAIVARAA